MFWNKIKTKEIEVKLATRKNGYRGKKTKVRNTIFVGERIRTPIGAVGDLSYDSIRIAVKAIGERAYLHPLIQCNPIGRGFKGCLGVRNKDDFIELYGIEAFNKWRGQTRDWHEIYSGKDAMRLPLPAGGGMRIRRKKQ
jgi:hypothetical protein